MSTAMKNIISNSQVIFPWIENSNLSLSYIIAIIYGNKARIYWCKHKRNLSWNFYENKGALVVVNHHLKNQICLSQTQTSIAQIVERCQNYGMTESLVSSFAVYTWVNMNIIEQINTFIKFFSSGNGLV